MASINGPPGEQLVIRNSLHRHSESGFAELLVPIVGERQRAPGHPAAGSGCRRPLRGLQRFRQHQPSQGRHQLVTGGWPPGARELWHLIPRSAAVGAGRASAGIFVQTYSDPLSPSGTSIGYTLGGGNTALKPETATTYSLGLDWQPIGHAKISLTYYHIDYKNQIGSYLSDLTILQQISELGSLVTRCPSAACSALVDQYVTGSSKLPLFGPPLANPSVFVNGLEQNLGETRTAGLDLLASYSFSAPMPGCGPSTWRPT